MKHYNNYSNRPFLQLCAMKQNVENKPVWCCILSHLNALKCAKNCSAGSRSKSGNMEWAWKLRERIATFHL